MLPNAMTRARSGAHTLARGAAPVQCTGVWRHWGGVGRCGASGCHFTGSRKCLTARNASRRKEPNGAQPKRREMPHGARAERRKPQMARNAEGREMPQGAEPKRRMMPNSARAKGENRAGRIGATAVCCCLIRVRRLVRELRDAANFPAPFGSCAARVFAPRLLCRSGCALFGLCAVRVVRCSGCAPFGLCAVRAVRPSGRAPFGPCAPRVVRRSGRAPLDSCALRLLRPSGPAPLGPCAPRAVRRSGVNPPPNRKCPMNRHPSL
jgi:hypothetical protein